MIIPSSWYASLNKLFRKKEQRNIFIYNNFYNLGGKTIYGCSKALKDNNINTSYYAFINRPDGTGAQFHQTLDYNIKLYKQLKPLNVGVASGLASSFWATCSTKGNSARYVEYNGYSWIIRFFKRHIQEQPLNKFKHLWITIWSDIGEDNFFVPAANPIPFHRNTSIPVWTHAGFYKLAHYYAEWWKTGSKPDMLNEAIYWSYRQHPKDLRTQNGDECAPGKHGTKQSLLDTWDKAIDAIFLVTRLKQQATLHVTLGDTTHRVDCKAGITQHQINWGDNRGKPLFLI